RRRHFHVFHKYLSIMGMNHDHPPAGKFRSPNEFHHHSRCEGFQREIGGFLTSSSPLGVHLERGMLGVSGVCVGAGWMPELSASPSASSLEGAVTNEKETPETPETP